jgi:hypothetical protein
MDRKVAFGGPQGYAARVLETFQTVSGKSSRKFASATSVKRLEKQPALARTSLVL